MSDGIGKWLSAALEDPGVCAEMKADIQAWFDAGEPPYRPEVIEIIDNHQYRYERQPHIWNAFVALRADLTRQARQ